MSSMAKLNELIKRRNEIECGGDQLSKTLSEEGHLSARERISVLLDEHSFVEIGAFVTHRTTDFNMEKKQTPADGVITGYGTVENRLVYIYSQDATVLGGALGEMHTKKIIGLYDLALKMGAPIIGLIDTAGLRLQESTDTLHAFGKLFQKKSRALGIIPQVTAILGNCGGGTAIIPSLSDFTFMTKNNSKLFINSPNTLDNSKETFETIATADFHSKKSGVVDFVCSDDTELLQGIKELIMLLPSNNLDEASTLKCEDDLNRVSDELNNLDLSNGVDSKKILTLIADNNYFYEIKKLYEPNMVIGFIRLNGSTIGVIANQTIEKISKLTTNACLKSTKFIKFCNAFNIPILTLTDITGFETNAKEEETLSRSVASMVYAFSNATVPKINVIVNRGYGSAYITMNSKHIGADVVYAWPTAQIAMMAADSAVRIMYADEINSSEVSDTLINEKIEEYESIQSSPYAAASHGYIDDIIEPSATRKRIIAAFEMLYSKKENYNEKKQGTIL